ncbi:dihydroxyacetone kinase phosphoryl donor subunit DhaM [Kineococcus rhizosphaerae]|uniref:phosphoenolpyruvate--glycerone phosphotransferase n=1 Tax=Kineococcus rhizosphaerae TaxID=559628 RepID=A0A2T0R7Z0_9ACTN|nr:dihydroxyacetone kinase phosphoryl donor subunit DhaM [Kineococcus rhizosphaerae]PRY17279.1 dihydroxyacetone kinase phosphotransfer subunit [Kineococcus rhizosphaerae]
MSVRVVLLSHSAAVARGVADLAGQMGRTATVVPVGGTPDGGLGTDADALETAVAQALAAGDDVALLVDLGSAVLTAKTVLADVDEDERVVLVDAPFLEGAVAAVVTASTGTGLAEVVAQAELARTLRKT